MNILEIIAQEENALKAKRNIEETALKSKAEILLPFAMQIFDFLEIINNSPDFLFSQDAHPSEDSWTPLFNPNFCDFDFHKEKVKEEIQEKGCGSFLTRKFSYGSRSNYIKFLITEDFKPFLRFSHDCFDKECEDYFSVEDAVRGLTKFFLENRKKL